MDLPGRPYGGQDPEGHVSRDEIVAYLVGYAERWSVPVRDGVRSDSVRRSHSSGFVLDTSDGVIEAETVVVCAGGFTAPHRLAGGFPVDLEVLTPTTTQIRLRSPTARGC